MFSEEPFSYTSGHCINIKQRFNEFSSSSGRLIEFEIDKERKSESAEKINADDNKATKLTAFDNDFGRFLLSLHFFVCFYSFNKT